ncbi:MAG: InlB B-repeat-containing protein [Rikenellaceae bacterium]
MKSTFTIFILSIALIMTGCAKDSIEELNTYIVTFETNDGSYIESLEVKHGSTVDKPTDPTKYGETFTGWCVDSQLIEEYNFQTAVTSDVTLYAKWSTTQYAVKFDSNGGDDVATQYVNHDSTATEPTEPTKTGHTFVGWYSDSSLSTTYNFTTSIIEDVTLYAKWSANTYKITFNSNGGSSVDDLYAEYGTAITEPIEPAKYGYTFVEWHSNSDLTSAWNFDDNITGDMTLYAKWGNIPDGYTPIYSAEDMYNIRNDLSGNYFLANGIDLSEYDNWTPIGASDSGAFEGIFDGNNKTILGLNINSTSSMQGLFGYTNKATIKDVKIYQPSVKSTSSYIGAVVGKIGDESIIENCSVEGGSIGGSSYIGGIGGSSSATITSCNNSGTVYGSGNYIGGIVGYSESSSVIDLCYNTGSVSGAGSSSTYTGGVVGNLYNASISYCYNTGYVKSNKNYVGGVVGRSYTSTVTYCYNESSVSGGQYVGGVVGESTNGSYTTYCYNTGELIVGSYYIGGVVGNLYNASFVKTCYNTGQVAGYYAGGVVGYVKPNSYYSSFASTSSSFRIVSEQHI